MMSYFCIAFRFAKLSGFSPIIITILLLHNRNSLTSFGATHVVDHLLPSKKIVDLAYDSVSEEDTVRTATAGRCSTLGDTGC